MVPTVAKPNPFGRSDFCSSVSAQSGSRWVRLESEPREPGRPRFSVSRPYDRCTTAGSLPHMPGIDDLCLAERIIDLSANSISSERERCHVLRDWD